MEELWYEEKKQAVIDEIMVAFDGVELGEGVSFHEAFVVDDYRIEDRNHELRREARAKDTESRWQDVPDDLIRDYGAGVFSFLDERGFHYYVPAFLVWYLRYVDSKDVNFRSETFGATNYHLNAGTTEGMFDFCLAEFSPLSFVQSQSVAHFLEFLIVREDKIETQNKVKRQNQVACGEMTKAQVRQWRMLSMGSSRRRDCAEQSLKEYWGNFLKDRHLARGDKYDKNEVW